MNFLPALLLFAAVKPAPAKPVSTKPLGFTTTNSCKVVQGQFEFRGSDGLTGKSSISCTAAFTEWAYTVKPVAK